MQNTGGTVVSLAFHKLTSQLSDKQRYSTWEMANSPIRYENNVVSFFREPKTK